MKLWRYGVAVELLGQRYRLDGVLGSGGMADVCLAWDEHEGREVAVKVMKSNELNQRSLDRFLKEASHVARWRHPNILRVYGDARFQVVSEAQGSLFPYIVMEYALGGDLHKRLQSGVPYAFADTLRIFEQLCQAVSYAHSQGVIHRDLKPLNILFRVLPDGSEQVVLSDFGLAVEMTATHFTFAAGGTLPYMAPEQLRGHAEAASDIFALGVILYQLCTGRYPFRRTIQDLRQRGPLVPPPLPSSIYPLLPPELDDVVLTALSENPADRFADALDFWDSIDAIITADTVKAIQRQQSSQHSARHSQSSIPNVPSPSSHGNSPTPAPISLSAIPARQSSLSGRTRVVRDSVANVAPQQTNPLSPISQVDLRDSDPALEDMQTNVPMRSQHSNPGLEDVQTNIPARSQRSARSVQSRQNSQGSQNSRSRQGDQDSQGSRSSIAPARRSPITPRPASLTPAAQRPQRAQPASVKRLLWLMPAVLIVLLGGLFFVYRPGSSTVLPHLPLLHPSAAITLVPASKLLAKNYMLTAVTGTPDPAQLQVAARQLTSTNQSQPQTVQGTGHMQTPGSVGKGTLTFFNGAFAPFSVSTSISIPGPNGVEIFTDNPFSIPAANTNTGKNGTVDVPAHVANVGIQGNIGAMTLNQTCCTNTNTVVVKNINAFTGGQDPKNYTFVQQGDVDGVVNALRNTVVSQAQAAVQRQVRPQDELAGSVQCTDNKQFDPAMVGDKGQDIPTTTVSLKVQCAQMAYDKSAASELAQSRLQQEAQPGAGYVLVGNISSLITVGAVDQQSVALQAQVQGRWVYAISVAQKQGLARLIVGKTSVQAKSILKSQVGIADVSITLNGTQNDQLPDDVTQIDVQTK